MRRIAALWPLVFLAACATSPNSGPPVRFDEVIARATTLTETGSVDEAKYGELVDALKRIREDASYYKSNAQNMLLAENFMKLFPSVTCELEVAEPDEKITVAHGYKNPLELVATCPAKAPFAFETTSDAVKLKGESFTFNDGKLSAKLRVEGVDKNPAKNTIRFGARYYASELLTLLRLDFDSVDKSVIAINPVEYKLARAPSPDESENGVALRSTNDSAVHEGKNAPTEISLKVEFKKGSIQLTREMREKIAALKISPGQKVRITGYGDKTGKNMEAIANLRARVIASFLNETTGEVDAVLEWKHKPDSGMESMAFIEGVK
ncbi:MAG: hypothetical protein LDLANPLL_01222 [Turneriella sp.]|nr:hypothetical protein [Turneriella sp.]